MKKELKRRSVSQESLKSLNRAIRKGQRCYSQLELVSQSPNSPIPNQYRNTAERKKRPLTSLEKEQYWAMRPEQNASSQTVNVFSKVQKVCSENLRGLTSRAGCCVVKPVNVKENRRPFSSNNPRNQVILSKNTETNNNMPNKLQQECIVDPATNTTYLIGKLLGKGGFARCYDMLDLKTRKVYAGKIIAKNRISNSNHKDKFKKEVDLHSRLDHPNVVRFYHYFEDHNHVYMILEKCSKKSLMNVLRQRSTITECEVRYYLKQLISAMKYIHSKFIVHRDLKLGNMLLNSHMHLKIADFGLASQIRFHGELLHVVCGTPNYIAPEVLRKSGYSYEADIWSIGCILYALLVGKPPFETDTLQNTYDRIKSNTYHIDNKFMSNEAKRLIRRLLHPLRLSRPSLESMEADLFFSNGFTPQYLTQEAAYKVINFKDIPCEPKKIQPVSNNNEQPIIEVVPVEMPVENGIKYLNDVKDEGLFLDARKVSTISQPAPLSTPSIITDIKKYEYRRTKSVELKPSTSDSNLISSDILYETNETNDNDLNEPSEAIAIIKDDIVKEVTPKLSNLTVDNVSEKDMKVSKDKERSKHAKRSSSVGRRDKKVLSMTKSTSGSIFNGKPYSLQSTLKAVTLCLDEMPNKTKHNPLPMHGIQPLWVTKWVDFSNRHGFGFLLSDGCVGVLFNDLTRAILSADKKLAHLTDLSNEIIAFDPSDAPTEEMSVRSNVLKFFSSYMEQNLIHGGNILGKGDNKNPSQNNPGVFMQRWFRTERAIVMRLSNGVFQVNFFKDHTKIILSPHTNDNVVTYVNSARKCTNFSLNQIKTLGCESSLRERLIYVQRMLQKSVEKKDPLI